LDLKWGNKG